LDEARAQAKEILRVQSKFSAERYVKTFPFQDKADTERLIDALRKAGLRFLAIRWNLQKLHITSANLAFLGVFSPLMQYGALPSRSVFSIQRRMETKAILVGSWESSQQESCK
jgi:hypothetical protein